MVPVFVGSALKNIGVRELTAMIAKHVPSAAEVGGRATTDGKQIEPDPSGPFVAQVFKTTADPFVGRLTYFRVVSGTPAGAGPPLERDPQGGGADRQHPGPAWARTSRTCRRSALATSWPSPSWRAPRSATRSSPIAPTPSSCQAARFPEPTLQVSIEPESKADLDKLGQALQRMLEEEPAMRVHREDGTGETILTAMGDAHVDVIVERLKRKFGASVKTGTPHVPYRETIRKPTKIDNRFKRQTGGHGQFGHVVIEFEPMRIRLGLRVRQQDRGRRGAEAVHPGRREGAARGDGRGRAGRLPGGRPEGDPGGRQLPHRRQREMAFKVAASQALKRAFPEANPTLLEPILEVEVVVPDEYMGDVMGQITAKRGHVLGMDSNDGMQHLRAQVPQAEMFHYATELRSITQGRGRFSWKLDHYAEVPHNVAEKVIAEHQAKVGAGEPPLAPEVSSCARPRRRSACPAGARASGRAAGRPRTAAAPARPRVRCSRRRHRPRSCGVPRSGCWPGRWPPAGP